MSVRLEHANLCVRDIDATLRFLRTAFPDFRIRADRTDAGGSRWVHVGTNETYIALTAADSTPVADAPGSPVPGSPASGSPAAWEPYRGLPGVNHLGYEVDDADALRQRMLAAGYEESTVPNAHPFRKRVYFLDADGNDWEFVEYLSSNPAERHDYQLV